MDFIYMTEEGYKKLSDEISRLESVDRPQVIEEIAEAREKGDLSENAEYSAAKEKQAVLEDKIATLRAQLANARILDTSNIDTSKVGILSKVTLTNMKNNQQRVFTIVSDTESDNKAGKIGISTPIAKGLLGRKPGEICEIKVPAGILTFRIDEISI